MQKLFAFIFRYRVFFVFIGIEFFCLYLIYSKNNYQKITITNSTNLVVGNLLETKNTISDYFDLAKKNEALAKYNAELIQNNLNKNLHFVRKIKNFNNHEFDVIASKVINNSVHLQNNYITLNKGKKDGIKKGMGVVTSKGIVGTVFSVSDNYSLVVSLLHSETKVSSKIKSTNTIGSVKWSGKNQKAFKLQYIPRHVKITKNDSILTSGYNAIYPENILIGTVKEYSLEKNDSFYDIDIELANNLSDLDFVYIVVNKHKNEIKELEENKVE